MRNLLKFATGLLLVSMLAWAQDLTSPKAPTVSMSPAPLTRVQAGKPGAVELRFHVVPGFHINSNTPKSEFLIPTVLKLDTPTDIVIGKVTYPKGEDLSFPFAPDEKLSVYSGAFEISVVVRPLRNVIPNNYTIRGQLRYQACDKAACYPPKNLPVEFEIKVAKAAVVHKGNPAQSPPAQRKEDSPLGAGGNISFLRIANEVPISRHFSAISFTLPQASFLDASQTP